MEPTRISPNVVTVNDRLGPKGAIRVTAVTPTGVVALNEISGERMNLTYTCGLVTNARV